MLLSWISSPALAQPIESPNLGICGLHYYSGLTVIDRTGQVVSLEEYCASLPSPTLLIEAPPVDGATPFWQAFLRAASPAAVEFANSVGQPAVVTYGATICPYLQDGGSMQELRQIQSQSAIPQSFEVAVTIAAIHTYCPDYRSQIGRRE